MNYLAAAIAVTFAAFFAYLWLLHKRVSKLEKDLQIR